MLKYKHLEELLKQRMEFVEGEDSLPVRHSYKYSKIPFSPERIVGLLVHSMLSDMPRAHFYTDGNYIYYFGNENTNFNPTRTQKEDIIKEDLLLEIIDAAPHNLKDSYETTNGHLRVSDFGSSFGGRQSNSPYFDYLRKISKEVPYNLLRKEERRNIRKVVQSESDDIANLLTALKTDKDPLPKFAEKLEKALAKYGYTLKKY